jgi:hypothetical protein
MSSLIYIVVQSFKRPNRLYMYSNALSGDGVGAWKVMWHFTYYARLLKTNFTHST